MVVAAEGEETADCGDTFPLTATVESVLDICDPCCRISANEGRDNPMAHSSAAGWSH